MKLLGIDYGKRRIGLATTDESGTFVRGLPTLVRKKNLNLLEEIVTIISKESPQALVFGLPLGYNEQETDMSRKIKAFAAKVKELSGLPVHFIDESYTSQTAARMLMSRKKKERKDKQNLDKIAACLILEAFQKEQ